MSSLTLVVSGTSNSQATAYSQTKTGPVQQPETISIPSGYVAGAMSRRVARQLEDGTWIGEIPGFEGVWSQGESETQVLMALHDVLIGWLYLKIEDHDGDIPVVGGINLNQ